MTVTMKKTGSIGLGVLAIGALLWGVLGGSNASASKKPAGAQTVAGDVSAAAMDFAVFRRARRQTDGPDKAVSILTRNHPELGLVASKTRSAWVDGGAAVARVVPGKDQVCLIEEIKAEPAAAGADCGSWAEAQAGRLFSTFSGGPEQKSGEAIVMGLVRAKTSGVTIRHGSGAAESAPISADGVFFSTSHDPTALVIRDGREHVFPLGKLPGRNE